MSFLPILLSKIKLHHVSELGVTCWVCCVFVGECLKLSIVLMQCATSKNYIFYTKIIFFTNGKL